jgi:peptidyl-prolyl cis-trans isomerase D
MLLEIRDKVTGWLAYIIIILISIPFALWGIQQYFGGGGSDVAAVVNGQEIPVRALDREYARYRQQLLEAFGGQLPGPLQNESVLKQQVLERMIEQEVLAQLSRKEGYRIGDQQLGTMIRSMQEFQRDGRFDKATYEAQLRSQGWTPAGFEAQLRQAAQQDQLREGITATATASRRESELLKSLLNQERDVAYLRLPLDRPLSSVTVADAKVREYYDTHPGEFMRPEQVRIAYLELDAGDLADEIKVSEDTLHRLYEERAELYGTPEKRFARHILIKVPQDASKEEVSQALETAESLRARILAGEDFATLAEEYSQDIGSKANGGDLGAVTRGVMVEPFERALFALKEGEVSEPVRTRFGWHVIKLDRIESGSTKPFEEVRDELESEYRRQQAENLLFDRAEQLANLTYENPDSLVVAAETMGLEVQETGWMTREHGDGIAADQRVRSAAFSPEVLTEGRNSDVLELDGGRLVVLRDKEHRESEPKAFEEVADGIRAKLRRDLAQNELREQGQEMLAAVREGEDPAQVAEHYSAELEELGYVRRDGGTEQRDVVALAFTLAPPQRSAPSAEGLTLADGDYAVVLLRDVRESVPPAKAVGEEERERGQQLASVEFRALLQDYLSRADIERRPLSEED